MTTLLTITHDPQGRQLPHFSPELFSLFDRSFIVVTKDTNPKLITKLAQHCIIDTRPQEGMCQARRDVVKLAWEHNPEVEQYFYCDFDRLLFWWHTYPDELRKVVDMKSQFMVLGRTEKAMATYPALQYETERAMNRIIRLRYSINFDLFAGARLFDSELSKMLMSCPGEDAVLDIEWIRTAMYYFVISPDFLLVDGLAYEAELLNMTRPDKEEMELRARNLKSILDYVGEK
jgi:hypothetical protein